MNNEAVIKLHSKRIALEQRIKSLKDPSLTEGKDVSSLLRKMMSMLEDINQQIYAETMPDEEGQHDNGYDSHPDHEVQMARSELYRAGQAAMALEKMLHYISEQQGLEGWVQAKITKAADYLESVYHYLDYEMKGHGVEEGVAAYGPGEDPNDPNTMQNQQKTPQAPGAPIQNPNAFQPGQQSATPQAGGSSPVTTSPGMVKMAKLDNQKKPIGTPIMVKAAEIMAKQKQGFFVIGEGKEEKKKVVHCSQCGKGFNSSGLTAPHHTGFSHCKDHKGMKIVAEDASGGASSAGGMASSMGGNGFANGGLGTVSRIKRKKKKIGESSGDYGPHSRGVADGYYGRPPNPHKMVTNAEGKRVTVKLTNPKEIKQYMAGYKDDSFGRKDYGESVEPKFTGQWKGKDKKKPGKKMVGDA